MNDNLPANDNLPILISAIGALLRASAPLERASPLVIRVNLALLTRVEAF
jgi:hypothetical protein